MREYQTVTIDLTVNRETRTIEATRYQHEDGTVEYFASNDLFAVRIGHGAKWHKPIWVQILEVAGKPKVNGAMALNKNASFVGWAEQVKHDSTKSQHVGSKMGA